MQEHGFFSRNTAGEAFMLTAGVAGTVAATRSLFQDAAALTALSNARIITAESRLPKTQCPKTDIDEVMAVQIAGIRAMRIRVGFGENKNKYAIIGRPMGLSPNSNRTEEGVIDFAKELRKMGKETMLFARPILTDSARDEMASLANLIQADRIPAWLVYSTQAYRQNVEWAKMVAREGYTIIDIGANSQKGFSPFYDAESRVIFGEK